MSRNQFKVDESVGKIAESLVTILFNNVGFKTEQVSKEERNFYDLKSFAPQEWKLQNNFFTTEVKHDVYFQKSGNIAIETWNSRKNEPSGVNLTKADLWAQVLTDSIWLCRVADLRNFTFTPPKRVVENAGDGNATIYLYDGEHILNSIFHRVDKLTVKELQAKLKTLCQTKY